MLSCFALKQLLGIPIVFGLHSCFGDRKYGFINFILSCFPLKSIEKKNQSLVLMLQKIEADEFRKDGELLTVR